MRLNTGCKIGCQHKSSDYHEKKLPNPKTNQGKIKPHGERPVKKYRERKKKKREKGVLVRDKEREKVRLVRGVIKNFFF